MKKLLSIFLLTLSINAFATNYYFATSGNDVNAGTISAPWHSIAKFNSVFASKSPGDQFLFNKGDVWTGTAMNISRNGTSGALITIGAYGTGAMPIISGFTNVTAWTNLGSNIWESTSAVSTLATLNMVAIGGVNTAMGRTPNYPTYYNWQSVTSTSLGSTNLNSSVTNWTGAELVDFVTTYTTARHTITGHSGSSLTYNNSNPDPNNQTPGSYFTAPFFIQNDSRTLDVQNEWYYNPSTKKIRVYSTSSPINVQAAALDNLVAMGGHTYIIFDGISFTGSNSDAILLSSAPHFTAQNCDFNYIGRDVVFDGGGSSKIDNCTVENCNNFGIDFKDNASDTVTNCTVSNIGMLIGMGAIPTPSLVGIGIDAYGNNDVVTGNTVDSTGLLSIRFGGDNSLIKNNFVQRFCYGNGVKDGGGLYMYHGAAGNTNTNVQLINNISINGGSDGIGIYFDDYVNGVICAGNTVANCRAGYQLHNVHNFLFRDNTSYNSSTTEMYLLMDDNSANNSTNITLKNNILFARDNRINGNNWVMWNNVYNTPTMPTPFTSDSNYLLRPINDNLTIVGFVLHPTEIETDMNLPMWQQRNPSDAHSKKSPLTITNVNQTRFEYNPTLVNANVNLGSVNYVDARNVAYSGTITLQPFTSVVLISTGVGNTPPTANAGSNQTITWPANSVTLSGSGSDPDGTIAAYQWSRLSGNGVINTPNSAGTTITGMSPGVSQFQLLVTDNSGATATDAMTVTVNQGSSSLSASGTTVTFNNSAQRPIITTSPAGIAYNLLVNGISAWPTNAGVYSYTAGNADPNWVASPISGTFTINQASATIVATNITANYDGLTHPGVATTTPAGLTGITHSYSSGGAPVSLGTYHDTIRLVNSNYQATQIIISITIVSNAAPIFISDTTFTFDSTAHNVTVTSAYTYSLTGSPRTNAGSNQVIATIMQVGHTGADTANITVLKQQSILSWIQTANMPDGSLLSALQLNATANVAGHYVYDYSLGTRLPIGATLVTGTFVPDDPSNILGGTISRTINVYTVNPFLNFIITPNGQLLFIKQ